MQAPLAQTLNFVQSPFGSYPSQKILDLKKWLIEFFKKENMNLGYGRMDGWPFHKKNIYNKY